MAASLVRIMMETPFPVNCELLFVNCYLLIVIWKINRIIFSKIFFCCRRVGFPGFLEIVHVAVYEFDGSVDEFPALIQELFRDEAFVICCDQVVQGFPAGAAGVAAVLGVVHVVEAPVAFSYVCSRRTC